MPTGDQPEVTPVATAALTVSQINDLLGIDIWRVRSFRANVQIDFDEFGNVLSVTLLNPNPDQGLPMAPDTAARRLPPLPPLWRCPACRELCYGPPREVCAFCRIKIGDIW